MTERVQDYSGIVERPRPLAQLEPGDDLGHR